MTHQQATRCIEVMFAPFPATKLERPTIDVWFEVALEHTEFDEGMRIAKLLAASSEYPPVPKHFVEIRRATAARKTAQPELDTVTGPETSAEQAKANIAKLREVRIGKPVE